MKQATEILITNTLGEDGRQHKDIFDLETEKQDQEIGFVESQVGNARFRILRFHAGSPKMTANIRMEHSHRVFVGPDEPVRIFVGRMLTADKRPGQAVGYEFYPSPAYEFVAVFRKIYRGVNVVYAYQAKAGCLIPLHFDRKRLDEYIITRYLQSLNKPSRMNDYAMHVFHFGNWIGGHVLRLRCTLQRNERDRAGMLFIAEVDLGTGNVHFRPWH